MSNEEQSLKSSHFVAKVIYTTHKNKPERTPANNCRSIRIVLTAKII
jgi:hypothetical protein